MSDRITRRRALGVVGGGLAVGIAGCSGDDSGRDDDTGTDAESTSETDGESDTPDDERDTGLDPGERYWSFETGGYVYSSPTIVDGTVYVGSEDRHLYALDATTGAEQWRFETEPTPPEEMGNPRMKGEGIRSTPHVADGKVFVGGNDMHVYGLDAETGDHLWDIETDGPVYASPVLVDDVVYVGSRGGLLYALDPETGEQLWTSEVGVSGVSPIVVDGKIFTGSYTTEKTVSCVDAATGEIEWRQDNLHTCSSPVYASERVIWGSLDDNIYALDPDTGSVEWETQIDGAQNNASPTAKDGVIYTTQWGGDMVALDATTGEHLWTAADTGSAGNQCPTTVDNWVVNVSQDAAVSVVDRGDGEMMFQERVHDTSDEPMVSSALVVDGVLFVGTVNDRSVHAMELPIDGHSDGARVQQQMKNYHDGALGANLGELEMEATGNQTAEGVSDITGYRTDPDGPFGDGPYDGWMQDVPNYEGATLDVRDQELVTVAVGAGPEGFQFDPPAILVQPGATAEFEWTGRGGAHNVVNEGGTEIAGLHSEEGHTERITIDFDAGWVGKYVCTPHEGQGMKGVIAAGQTDDEIVVES